MTAAGVRPANLRSPLRVQVIAPAALGDTTIAALAVRGISARTIDQDSVDVTTDVVGWALEAIPSLARTVELAATCRSAALAGRPVCLLVPEPRGAGRPAIERHAAIAYLRAHGAAIGHDVDAWLEAIVCLVRFGLPAGSRSAVIAPPGSWLESQAVALASELVGAGSRPPMIGDGNEPTDVALYDASLGAPTVTLPILAIPVVARGELAGETSALFSVRGALGATAMLGRAAERTTFGLGPAPREASAELGIDREKLDRELARQHHHHGRIGDHETKVMLSAYRVEITRQAVAQTPSAAVKLARRAGYPVEIKQYGPDVPPEPACVVVRAASDALVRQAFASIVQRDPTTVAVIVRETPPPGREIAV
ncbi:MAG: acetate--CoA ligase family protein, partial [Proteobacteria bacterium]|nr:acetate--CoA ligase family protein [Pseudomonadota bacterium]